MKTPATVGNAVRRGRVAFMAGVSAFARTLIAKAQFRPADGGDGKSHRRHHDSRDLSHSPACRNPKHFRYYTINLCLRTA